MSSTLEMPSVEDAVANILSGRLEDSEIASCEPHTLRRVCLAVMGRRASEEDDAGELLREACTRATRALEADHFAFALASPSTAQLNLRWGTIFPDVLGDGAGEQLISYAPGESASGHALQSGLPLVITNLSAESRFSDPVLERLEASSGVVCSLGGHDRTLGTLGVFTRNARSFQDEEVLFLHSLSQMLGLSISQKRTEKMLQSQSRFLGSLMESTEAVVLVLGLDGSFVRVNQAGERLTGFQLAELRTRNLWGALLLPEEIRQVKQAFDCLRRGESPVRMESYVLTKHGERRRINWSFALTTGDDGSPNVIATGIDITQQQDLAQRLERAESTAADVKRTLADLKAEIERGEKRLQEKAGGASGKQLERRTVARRAFPHVQVVAPVIEGRLPLPSEYCEIRCRDISPKGFSFLTPTPYEYKQVVIGFGPAPSHLYLLADVMHTTPFAHAGRNVYLVGCQYRNRVTYSAAKA